MRASCSSMKARFAAALTATSLVGVAAQISLTFAQTYPTYPATQTFSNSRCGAAFQCQDCSGSVVYGASPATPEKGYGQGNCGSNPGGGSCTGTYYECEKLQCKYLTGSNPPEYLYKGNWCKTGS